MSGMMLFNFKKGVGSSDMPMPEVSVSMARSASMGKVAEINSVRAFGDKLKVTSDNGEKLLAGEEMCL